MIRRLLRGALKLLTSATLALALIAFVGAWSLLATVIPQEATSAHGVVEAWAAANPLLAPVVEAVGLHSAFGSDIFIAAVVLLALSSAACAWGRTKVALRRARVLSQAASLSVSDLAGSHDFEIAVDRSISSEEALLRTERTLAELGVRTRRRDGVLLAVSPWWSVWGSMVFHWALVGMVLAVFAGALLRAEGSMPIAVGDQKVDQESSYLSVQTGPWHRWSGAARTIRVDDFDPAVEKDGIDLGAVPTVSVLDENGDAVVTQQVYPNKKLHAGSLSIYQPTCGLTVRLALTTKSGKRLPEVVQLVDFSQETSGGTVPVQPMVLSNNAGQVILRLEATVPLDRDPRGGYGEWIPRAPAANVILTDGSGNRLLDQTIRTGESGAIEGGGTLEVVDLGWYSALVVVDDPTIPFIYGSMIIAMLGLALSVSSRQQLIVLAVARDGGRLVVRARLWRYVTTTIDEMRDELQAAFGSDREGTVS